MARINALIYRISILFGIICVINLASCNGGISTNASAPSTQNAGEEDDEIPTKPTPKPDKPDEPCHYNGHQLHIGKKGGCYYLYDEKKREYVDRTYCDSCPHEKKSSKSENKGK